MTTLLLCSTNIKRQKKNNSAVFKNTKFENIKPWPNDHNATCCNMATLSQHVATVCNKVHIPERSESSSLINIIYIVCLRVTLYMCIYVYVQVLTLLVWVLLAQISRLWQPTHRNMLCPTMLPYVAIIWPRL